MLESNVLLMDTKPMHHPQAGETRILSLTDVFISPVLMAGHRNKLGSICSLPKET